MGENLFDRFKERGGAWRMKRGTPRHPKVYDLMQALGLPIRGRATVIGYLELLWHFTAEFAPQGDIGRYSNDRIEGAMDWGGKAGKLIEALTNTGWCDVHAECRLVVHDWHDHADDAIRKRLARSDMQFLTVTGKVTGQRRHRDEIPKDEIGLPVPEPEPVPEPVPSTNTTPTSVGSVKPTKSRAKRSTAQIEKALGERLPSFNRCWEIYPCPDGKRDAMDTYERLVKDRELAIEIFHGVERYAAKMAADPTLRPKYFQGWLTSERWKDGVAAPIKAIVPSNGQALTDRRRSEALATMEAMDRGRGRA